MPELESPDTLETPEEEKKYLKKDIKAGQVAKLIVKTHEYLIEHSGEEEPEAPDVLWQDVLLKPFSTVDISGILSTSGDKLSASVSWDDVNNKPFETLGESLIKNSDGSLGVDSEWLNQKIDDIVGNNGGELPSVDWTNVTNRPFASVGDYLSTTSNKLSVNVKAIGATQVRAMIEEITNA